MIDTEGTWPDIPPEVPPPRRPDGPEEPARPPAVPLVPLVLPTEKRARQVDHELMAHRTLLLLGSLDDDVATRLAAQLMTLDAEGEDEITLHLSCQEGELLAALMVAETIDLATSPVVVLAKGVVGGVALAPFAAAHRRVASSHVTFRMSEPRLCLSGVANELTAEAEEVLRHVDRLHGWIATATGQPKHTIAEDFRRGRTLDADAALAYGLIDEIATGSKK